MSNINEDLKKILLAGVGAIATTAEKGKQVVDVLVEKGQLTVEQGKVLNEELKREFKAARENYKNKNEKVKKHDEVKDEIYSNIDKLNKEEIAELQDKLRKIQEEKAE